MSSCLRMWQWKTVTAKLFLGIKIDDDEGRVFDGEHRESIVPKVAFRARRFRFGFDLSACPTSRCRSWA